MKKKTIVKLITIPIFIGVIFFGIMLSGGYYYNRPPFAHPNEDVYFTVSKGASVHTVAGNLEEENLIRSALFFKALVRGFGTERELKAGAYKLPGGAHAVAIHDLLVYGTQVMEMVSIPEGMKISQVAEILEAKSIVSSEEFLAAVTDSQLLARYDIPASSFQGYLYPDTYNLPASATGDEIIDIFLSNFFNRLGSVVDLSDYSPEEIYQKVIMASIVEREYRVADEAPLMASVFYNRLNDGKRLESCATIMYIITEELGKPYPKRLLYSDLEIDSEFNTYSQSGLPPMPISNPGLVALRAAFEPAQTGFYYFVVNNPEAGTHKFSTTLEEHNISKFNYKRLTGN